MNEFERFIIVETMGDHYQDMEAVLKKVKDLTEELETEVLKAEGTDDDELDFEVLDFLNRLTELEDEKDYSMEELARKVLAMTPEMQEYDFKDDAEYRVFHDGIYQFLHEFIVYASSIIEVCLFLDNETTVAWALENGYFDDLEDDE